jgi:hypothetical protein
MLCHFGGNFLQVTLAKAHALNFDAAVRCNQKNSRDIR